MYVVVFLAVVLLLSGCKPDGNGHALDEPVDIELDQESAVAIAEIVLVKVYGQEVLSQRPWKVRGDDKVFTIEGSLPPGYLGGVANIKIRRSNSEIVSLFHEK